MRDFVKSANEYMANYKPIWQKLPKWVRGWIIVLAALIVLSSFSTCARICVPANAHELEPATQTQYVEPKAGAVDDTPIRY